MLHESSRVTIWHTLKWTAWKRTYECSGHWHSLRSWFVSWAEHKLKAAIAPDSPLADLPVPASPDNIINARFKVSGGIQPLGKPLLYELLQEGEAGQLGQEGLNSGIKFPRNCHLPFCPSGGTGHLVCLSFAWSPPPSLYSPSFKAMLWKSAPNFSLKKDKRERMRSLGSVALPQISTYVHEQVIIMWGLIWSVGEGMESIFWYKPKQHLALNHVKW